MHHDVVSSTDSRRGCGYVASISMPLLYLIALRNQHLTHIITMIDYELIDMIQPRCFIAQHDVSRLKAKH